MSEVMSTKVGHALAKVLGIKLEPSHYQPKETDGVHTYVDPDPTAGDWIRDITPTGAQVIQYFYSLFPFLHWIGFYNVQWLIGDLVAGQD